MRYGAQDQLRAMAVLALVLTACGAETQGKGDDKALAEFATCKEERTEAKGRLDTCLSQYDALKKAPVADAGPTEFLVRYDGDALVITGKTRGGKPYTGGGELSAEEQTVTESVTSLVRGSKTAIERCYVQALKADDQLESRPINLEVKVIASPDGGVSNASFSPKVSSQFDSCMKAVAKSWKVKPYKGRSFPIIVTVRLQPA